MIFHLVMQADESLNAHPLMQSKGGTFYDTNFEIIWAMLFQLTIELWVKWICLDW